MSLSNILQNEEMGEISTWYIDRSPDNNLREIIEPNLFISNINYNIEYNHFTNVENTYITYINGNTSQYIEQQSLDEDDAEDEDEDEDEEDEEEFQELYELNTITMYNDVIEPIEHNITINVVYKKRRTTESQNAETQDSNIDCAICLQEVATKDTCQLNCSHEYCGDCMGTFLKKHRHSVEKRCCPLCREPISEVLTHTSDICDLIQDNVTI
jgi:hypothetical protein